MRLALLLGGLLLAAQGVMPAANAAPKVDINIEWYEISGQSVETLAQAMDRRGPRHGFLARAIAQTRYSMNSDARWVHQAGHCRPADVNVRLAVTYVYPRVRGPVPRAVARKWEKFMAGVRRHEETHGRIAGEMAKASLRAIRKMKFADTAGCHASRARLKAELDRIIAAHERRQVAFDEEEHRDGGRVDSLMARFLKR